MTLNINEIRNIEEHVQKGKLDKETARWICLIHSSVKAFKEWNKLAKVRAKKNE